MKDYWYADKRDLLKWSVLLTLAERTDAPHHVLQVLYHRRSTWHDIDLDRDGAGDPVPIPIPVLSHFRDAAAIKGLESPVLIEVISDPFENREEYLKLVIDRIKTRTKPGIVFLDPDTGLQPKITKPKMEHVLETELKALWDSLSTGDTLVLYQHQTNYKGEEWMTPKREQFEKALDLRPRDARVACSARIARDVAFIYATSQV
jgi:hypothetical protein